MNREQKDQQIIEQFLPRLAKHFSNVDILCFLAAYKRQSQKELARLVEPALLTIKRDDA